MRPSVLVKSRCTPVRVSPVVSLVRGSGRCGFRLVRVRRSVAGEEGLDSECPGDNNSRIFDLKRLVCVSRHKFFSQREL